MRRANGMSESELEGWRLRIDLEGLNMKAHSVRSFPCFAKKVHVGL